MSPSPFSSQFSSGDATADRRADYARMLAEGGDFAAAAELIEQALELTPGWAAGWFRLGEYRDKAGLGTAADAYRQTLALRPDDVFGARLKLALIGAEQTPDRPPSRYVEGLFDDYADRFDTALVGKLGYSVPGKLAALVMPHGPFRNTADLGCGTGLFGAEIRGATERLEGFDLSLNMLARAQAKGLYDHLGQSDLSLASNESGLFSDLAAHRADLVSAADVLMYLGSLETVFPLVNDLLSPRGFFAFSVEDAGEGAGFVLRDSLRYAHSEAYIRTLLSRFGFDLLKVENTVIRMDAGKPIHGILFLSQKHG
ncbi:putative TPR repeat methyltransferase [Neorhizobium galegae]|uniref:class I SAM-dependent DNA methyltransferase n=1 Tax=Neorhizobium galegae TaxID=399 RepID=UPI001AEAEC5A|nr:methyltransferase [Neorhizobium galegae]MBP2562021.1 putative TPR repeat methyltransferase [Neorhizobium galegae]MDQ0133996.1 putative TPR repeat methyltransferase [Neorhizobium galegae]